MLGLSAAGISGKDQALHHLGCPLLADLIDQLTHAFSIHTHSSQTVYIHYIFIVLIINIV